MSIDAARKGPEKRLSWLDTLRGGAALAVVIGHYEWVHIPGFEQFPFDPGVFGVSLFFLVSGYIIPKSVEGYRDRRLQRFIVNRFFRLVPVYWAAILLASIALRVDPPAAAKNLSGLQLVLGGGNIIGATWTLQVEFVFYCWVALALVTNALQRLRFVELSTYFGLVCSLACGMARFYFDKKAPVALPVGMTTILAGYWIHLAQAGLVSREQFITIASIVAGGLGLTFCLSYNKDWGYHEQIWRFFGSNALAALVFGWALFRPQVNVAVFSAVATFSYPLYLLHQPMQELIRSYVSPDSWLLGDLITFIPAIAASVALHLAIERPGIKIGQQLLRRANPPALATAASVRPDQG